MHMVSTSIKSDVTTNGICGNDVPTAGSSYRRELRHNSCPGDLRAGSCKYIWGHLYTHTFIKVKRSNFPQLLNCPVTAVRKLNETVQQCYGYASRVFVVNVAKMNAARDPCSSKAIRKPDKCQAVECHTS